MGKRLDQLDLSSAPLGGDDLTDLRAQADQAEETITELLDSQQYDFAWGLLVDMRTTIRQTGRVTQRQRQAIANIREGGDRQRERARKPSRRYEGWEPSH